MQNILSIDPTIEVSDFCVSEDFTSYRSHESRKEESTITKMPSTCNHTHVSRSSTPDYDQKECCLAQPIMLDIPFTESNDFYGNKSCNSYHWDGEGDAHYKPVCLPAPEFEAANLEKVKSHCLPYYPKPDGPINGPSPGHRARQHYLPASTASTITAASTVQVQTLADITPPRHRSVVSFADPLVTRIHTEGLSRQSSYRYGSIYKGEKNLVKEDELAVDFEKMHDILERGPFISAEDRRSRRQSCVTEPCQCRGFIRLHRFVANTVPLLFLLLYSWVYHMLNVVERLWALELSMLVTSCMGLYISGYSHLSTKNECCCKCLECGSDHHSPPDPGLARSALPVLFMLGTLISFLAFTFLKQSDLFDIVFLLHGFATTIFLNAWCLYRGCPK